jgi:hypothetical protein
MLAATAETDAASSARLELVRTSGIGHLLVGSVESAEL